MKAAAHLCGIVLCVSACAVAPARSSTLYSVVSTGQLFASTDQGATWTVRASLPVQDAVGPMAGASASTLFLVARAGQLDPAVLSVPKDIDHRVAALKLESLGVHIDVSHLAATPPGLTVTVDVECVAVDGKRLTFHVRAHDGVDLIGEGKHQRAVVMFDRFNARVAQKAEAAKVSA